jgi:hypothetical protein
MAISSAHSLVRFVCEQGSCSLISAFLSMKFVRSGRLALCGGQHKKQPVTSLARFATGAMLFAISTVGQAGAQSPTKVVRIPDSPTCSSCTTTLQRVATLGVEDGLGEIEMLPTGIRADGRGRYWILPGDGGPPRVYSTNGRYLTTVGRKGAGPGEFSSPSGLLPLPGDSMLVVDLALSRATVIGPNLKAHRTIVYPRGLHPEAVLSWPRSVILQGWMPTSDHAGFQLHHASLAGAEVKLFRSFTPDSAQWKYQWDFLSFVRAIPTKTGLWSFHRYVYRFTRWASPGVALVDYERAASWFPRVGRVNPLGNARTPPAPTTLRIIPIDSQRVWSVVATPSPAWRQAWTAVGDLSDGPPVDIPTSKIGLEYLFHTVIEEIDLKSAQVVSRTRVDKWIIGALDDGRVMTYEVDPQGVPRVGIYALASRR